MHGRVKNRGDQRASLQNTTSTTSDDVRALRNLLEGNLGGFSGKRDGQYINAKGFGKGPAATDLAVVALDSGPVVAHVMTVAKHEGALSLLGVSEDRADVQRRAWTIPEHGIPCVAWWTEIANEKNTGQWRRKLEAIGASNEYAGGKGVNVMGTLLFQFLDEDGGVGRGSFAAGASISMGTSSTLSGDS